MSYGNWTHGGRVFEYTEDPTTFEVTMETWIREETGDIAVQTLHNPALTTDQQYVCSGGAEE